jgi:hypothetical protein
MLKPIKPAKGVRTLRVLEGIFTDSAIDRADFIRLLSELIATVVFSYLRNVYDPSKISS